MEDTNKENEITPEYKASHEVLDALYTDLYFEGLGKIDESLINSNTALPIANQIIGRRIEEEYLDARAYASHPEYALDANGVLALQESTGKLHDILLSAKKGDFRGLKELIDDEGSICYAVALDDTDDEMSNEEKLRWAHAGELLYKTSLLLPDEGDGERIILPKPLAVEKPEPLIDMLKRLAEGGEESK